MNLFILLAVTTFLPFTHSIAAENCPSIDQTIDDASLGNATKQDVENAILCKMPNNCDFKLMILTNRVVYVNDQYDLGEATKDDLFHAAKELANAKVACTKY